MSIRFLRKLIFILNIKTMDLIKSIVGSDIYSIIDDYTCTNILMVDGQFTCICEIGCFKKYKFTEEMIKYLIGINSECLCNGSDINNDRCDGCDDDRCGGCDINHVKFPEPGCAREDETKYCLSYDTICYPDEDPGSAHIADIHPIHEDIIKYINLYKPDGVKVIKVHNNKKIVSKFIRCPNSHVRIVLITEYGCDFILETGLYRFYEQI